jgi:UDP-N-acetylmuramyl pentapeptide synthase
MIIGLGDMLELGEESIPAHVEAGAMVAETGAHYFVVIGDYAQEMIRGAVEGGFPPDRALVAASHEDMAERIRAVTQEGDLVLLKGSRGAALDKVVRILMGKG